MDKKLHILFLSGWYPSRVSPLNGDFVQRHAEAVATKHQVTVIHVITDENLKEREHSSKLVNNVLTKIIYVPKTSNPIFKFFTFFNIYLKEIHTIGDFDLTHLNITFPKGMIALFLKLVKNKPYIISEHWTGYLQPNSTSIGFIQKKITQFIVKKASYICPVSKNLGDAMTQFGLTGNYIPIPNVVNTNLFNFKEPSPNVFTLTHISHLRNDHKNIIGILNVIKKLHNRIPHFKFYLIGEYVETYTEVLNKLGLTNVILVDQIQHKEVPEYLNTSSAFVLFSNYENLPCVILEAFACGIPVVTTNVGGIKEYFPKNFGYLINRKDEIALENAILKIFNKELAANKLEMHTYAEKNFGVEKICESYSKLYSKTLKTNN